MAAQARKLNSFTVPPSVYTSGGGWNAAEYGPGRDADDVSVDSLGDGSDSGPTSGGGPAVNGRPPNSRAVNRERQQHQQQRGKDHSRKGLTKSNPAGAGKHLTDRHHAAVGDASEGGWSKDTGYLSREGGLGLGDGVGGTEEEDDAHVTVGAVSLMVDKSNKRAARLSAKLKRLATEKEELRDRYEALCKRERQVRDGVGEP